MKRHATAIWNGSLGEGQGALTTQSGALTDHGYSFKSRFEDESGKSGTNPEELLAAAHAGCFAMQLSHFLAENGTPADELKARAVVTVEQTNGGFEVRSSALTLEGKVPGVDDATFQSLAAKAKSGCPISKALGAIEVTLDARLV
ncbi:OsmC family protein [Aureimonas fodinaquatilis]|uniref:OsmC family protein n=1 Tax=Aureimonas fodinaquatilis TaxID=2565783 RepID=A0A5B0DRV9_9HYPH|nr:OsmC family protein [Aureimonas fodinaquatilis]KAA0968280.1 OsmC family protein [Aureimonas fodinaquatilis]